MNKFFKKETFDIILKNMKADPSVYQDDIDKLCAFYYSQNALEHEEKDN